jgi:hypothetical protein
LIRQSERRKVAAVSTENQNDATYRRTSVELPATLKGKQQKMKTFLLTTLSLMACSFCYSSEELEMKVRAAYKAADQSLVVAFVLVNNTENKITLLTKPDSNALARGADGILVIQSSFGGMREMFGHELVPSLSPYEPVTLNPGEATGFHIKMFPKTVEIEEGEEVRIQYSIGENLSKKYDLWPSLVLGMTELLFM